MHSTNYENAFILIAEDCKAATGKVPPRRGDKKTVASLEYELIANNPYKFTQRYAGSKQVKQYNAMRASRK